MQLCIPRSKLEDQNVSNSGSLSWGHWLFTTACNSWFHPGTIVDMFKQCSRIAVLIKPVWSQVFTLGWRTCSPNQESWSSSCPQESMIGRSRRYPELETCLSLQACLRGSTQLHWWEWLLGVSWGLLGTDLEVLEVDLEHSEGSNEQNVYGRGWDLRFVLQQLLKKMLPNTQSIRDCSRWASGILVQSGTLVHRSDIKCQFWNSLLGQIYRSGPAKWWVGGSIYETELIGGML